MQKRSSIDSGFSAPNHEPIIKNEAAVSLGRLGGLKGGPARAAKLSKKKRKEIASKAAKARWSNAEPKHGEKRTR